MLGLTALCLGEPRLGPGSALTALVDPGHPWHVAVWQVRTPRVVLGALAGAALGVSGLLLQDVLRNPIAGPELLGVSSGAAVVTATVVVLGLGVPVVVLPYAALAGALVAGALVLLAIGRTRAPDHVALVGAAVSAACGGLVVAVVGLGTQGDVVSLFRYLLGSLAARGWTHVEAVAPWLVVGITLAALLSRRVEALTLGDEVAVGLGVPVVRTRVAAVAVAAVLAAAVASVCGPVAFVALLSPHLARRICGSVSTRRVFWSVPVVGAALLMSADLVSRLVLYPVELPVGVATTLVGVPSLVLVLRGRAPELAGSR
ncbi:FecCD family ABC transporter permease [Nocardioides plantarum]|uniref:FecCD family ABC transporter permease n=1 Tax=Nocardioides plantarum TaxID=29299 RepID=A0ABV5K8U1_9ACTN|nr:iron ABC transporter permease [Nocardioides plantarum]